MTMPAIKPTAKSTNGDRAKICSAKAPLSASCASSNLNCRRIGSKAYSLWLWQNLSAACCNVLEVKLPVTRHVSSPAEFRPAYSLAAPCLLQDQLAYLINLPDKISGP